MAIRKLLVQGFFIMFGVISVSLFWKNTPALIAILVALSYLRQKFTPIKKPTAWFILSGFLGVIAESFTIKLGSP